MSAYLLSSGISKVAEEFIVRNHVGPAVLAPVVQTLDNAIHRLNNWGLDIIDYNQFGAVPNSSCLSKVIL